MALNLLSGDVEVWIAGVLRTDVVLYEVGAACNNKPEYATFEILSVGNNDPTSTFEGTSPQFANAEINIKIGSEWVHFGKIAAVEMDRGPQGERTIFTSRLDNHLFGDPLWGAPVAADSELSEILKADGIKLRMNPLHEGIIVENRVRTADSPGYSHGTFLTAEQFFESPSESPSVRPWALSYAVETLCEWMNPLQLYVNNPTFSQLEAVLPYEPAMIRDLTFPFGIFLPEALDALLVPLNYGWKVHHVSKTVRNIEVYKRGSSNSIAIAHSTANYVDSLDKAWQVNVKNDIVSNSVTDVTVLGGKQQVETTIELSPDWDKELEGNSAGYYLLNSDEWVVNPDLSRVFRRWTVVPSVEGVTNRSGMDAVQWSSLIGVDSFFKDPFFSRRQFNPCITQRPNGRPYGRFAGCFIEYKVKNNEWKPVEGESGFPALKGGLSIDILDDELGIYFNGKEPPPQIAFRGDEFRLRITATVESTARHIANKAFDTSELDDEKRIVLDMETAFPFRRFNDSQLNDNPPNGAIFDSEVDSKEEMEEFAQSVLDRQKFPATSGSIVIPEIDAGGRAHLGKTISDITGLGFDFSNGHSYPTVKAWVVDVESQTTTLVLGD